MGWWNAPENSELTVGDAVLDSARHFLKEFSKDYQEDLSRKPTVEELEYVLNLAFRVNADDEVLANFEELEIKQVAIKTAKRSKRQKAKPGDIFAFELDDGRFGFGRIVSNVSIGSIAEIFDYFANHPVFDYTRLGKWLVPPFPIDSFSLLERGKEGNWKIIGQTPNYEPGNEFKNIRFVYGNSPNGLYAADIFNKNVAITVQEAKGLPDYSPLGDRQTKKLIANKVPPKKSSK